MAFKTTPPLAFDGSPLKPRDGESSNMEFWDGRLLEVHPEGFGADGGAGDAFPAAGKVHVGGGGA